MYLTDKKAMRRILLEQRREFADKKASHDKIIAEKLINDTSFQNAGVILIYVSYSFEVDTIEIIKKCFETGRKVAVPRVNGGSMDFILIDSFSVLQSGYKNIPEPVSGTKAEITRESLCVVPALCYDSNGYRIGYGKGFYDRFLSGFTGVSIGICYSDFIRDFMHSPNDIPVQRLITG